MLPSRIVKALATSAALALAALTGGGTAEVAANQHWPCKWVDYTIEPGKSKHGQSCSWKYGCSCVVRSCWVGGRWRTRGTGKSCTQLPG